MTEENSEHPTRRRNGTFKKGFTANRKGPPRKADHINPPSPFNIRFVGGSSEDEDDQGLTLREKQQLRIFKAALADSKRAWRRVLKWMLERHEERLKRARHHNRKPVPRVIEYDPANVDDALLLLGIAHLNTHDHYYFKDTVRKRLYLEPWAVQAALTRRHGGKRLSKDERQWIERTTAHSKKLRWPRGYEG